MRTTVRSKKAECTGCSACALICPKHAISMRPDVEGFLYPSVNDTCVNCDQCERRCPSGVLNQAPLHEAWAAQNRSLVKREAASSGAIFIELAEQTLMHGGVVFGAVFDEKLKVEHVGSITLEDVEEMRGSKYVQSDIYEGMRHAVDLVRRKIPVLFSGAPCQIAGLHAALGNNRPDHLLTVDFVCHGTPSPGVFASYLKELEAEKGKRITAYRFRDKTLGWKNFSAKATFEDGDMYSGTQTTEPYLLGFLQNLYLRPACHFCMIRDGYHAADLTLGDLWGASEILPGRDDDTGLSLVIANTEYGKRALGACVSLDRYPLEDLSLLRRVNPSLFEPSKPHERRERFFKFYQKEGFRKRRIQKLLHPGRAERFLTRICRLPGALKRRLNALR